MSFAHTFEMSNNNAPYKIKNLNIQVLAPTNIRQFLTQDIFQTRYQKWNLLAHLCYIGT